jgi:hypothetical protein
MRDVLNWLRADLGVNVLLQPAPGVVPPAIRLRPLSRPVPAFTNRFDGVCIGDALALAVRLFRLRRGFALRYQLPRLGVIVLGLDK